MNDLSKPVPDDYIQVSRRCLNCNTPYTFVLPADKVAEWRNGAFIQDALPMLSANERELLISGMCGKCFDSLFE